MELTLDDFVKEMQTWVRSQSLNPHFMDKSLLKEKGFYTTESPFFELSKKLHNQLGEPRRTWERWLICLTQAPCVAVNLERYGRRCHFSLEQQKTALAYLQEQGDLMALPHWKKAERQKVYFTDLSLINQVIEGKGPRFETVIINAALNSVQILAKQEQGLHGYFWQNPNKQEVDLVVGTKEKAHFAFELKAGEKVSKSSLKPLEIFTGSFGVPRSHTAVIFSGTPQERSGFQYLNPM